MGKLDILQNRGRLRLIATARESFSLDKVSCQTSVTRTPPPRVFKETSYHRVNFKTSLRAVRQFFLSRCMLMALFYGAMKLGFTATPLEYITL